MIMDYASMDCLVLVLVVLAWTPVVLLGDPHLLEGREGGQDGATDPDGYMVVPPDMTVLAYRSFLMSTSHFMMEELLVVSWMQQASMPKSWAGGGPRGT